MSDYRINIEGDVEYSAIAVGPRTAARTSVSDGSAKTQASRLLNEFIAALETYGSDEPYVTDLRDLAESAKAEVTADRPNKGRIRSQLEGIRAIMSTMTSTLIGAADLANALDKIRIAVGHL